MLETADIVFFEDYIYTDENALSKPNTVRHTRRFALILLPQGLWQYVNQIYCCVITHIPSRNIFKLILLKTKYSCFSQDSFACFDRVDLEPLSQGEFTKKDELDLPDLRRGLQMIRRCLANNQECYNDKAFRGTLIREWKKKRDSKI